MALATAGASVKPLLDVASPVPPDIDIAQSTPPVHIASVAQQLGLEPDEYDLHGSYTAKARVHFVLNAPVCPSCMSTLMVILQLWRRRSSSRS